MSISATPPVAGNLSGAGQMMPQANQVQSANAQQSISNAPSETSKLDLSLHADKSNGFANNLLDGVYTEIDKIKVESEIGNNVSPVDTYKSDLSPKMESISPMSEKSVLNETPETVKLLSKTFDHAIFMAMVNQVLSGVSDSSRTLIRQT